MKQVLLALVLFFVGNVTLAQGYDFWNRCGDTLDIKAYPSDSFSLKQYVYPLGRTTIELSVLHFHFIEYEADQAWIAQRRGGCLLHSAYLGSVNGTESGVALPREQIIPDYFLIYSSGEFSGTYFLIGKSGAWYTLPGAGLIANQEKTVLYTYVPAECAGCMVAKFTLSSRTLATMMSTSGEYEWKEVTDPGTFIDVFGEGRWLRWE
ncbi:MAG: hypothetical protein IPL65_14080 [Lewinellaceae bacterium]|nr:hypothetical protein [Lewinellaceae bacterium]